MSEVCAVFLVKPWLDRSGQKPKPERLNDIVLPERKEKEKDQVFLGRCKPVVLEQIKETQYEIRATPSLVADPKSLKATFVCYVTSKGPGPKDIKRRPVRRDGVAARTRGQR